MMIGIPIIQWNWPWNFLWSIVHDTPEAGLDLVARPLLYHEGWNGERNSTIWQSCIVRKWSKLDRCGSRKFRFVSMCNSWIAWCMQFVVYLFIRVYTYTYVYNVYDIIWYYMIHIYIYDIYFGVYGTRCLTRSIAWAAARCTLMSPRCSWVSSCGGSAISW